MNNQQSRIQKKPIINNENDFRILIKTIWSGRKTIIRFISLGAIIGIAVALFSEKEFTVVTVMVPQVGNDNQSKLGGLGGLAALAGINIDLNQGNELSPLVYPQIVSSVPFQVELMNTPLTFKDFPMRITLFDYYTKYAEKSISSTVLKYSIGLPGLLLKAIRGNPEELVLPKDSTDQPILLTKDQFIVKKLMDDLVTLDINPKEGYITLTTHLPEALAAAQLAQKSQALMQRYITDFKIQKVKANLEFIQGRYNEIKTEFEKAQVSLAIVNDRNKSFTSGLPQIEADRIQTRYTIALNVFQEMAKQLEQAKIQVKKETPVFTIVEPVTVPTEKSKPKRPMILFLWIFIGGIVGTGVVIGKEYIQTIKKQWTEE